MKRIISTLLVLTLILGTMTTAFAKQNDNNGKGNDKKNGNSMSSRAKNMDKAKVLYDLKLFSGVSTTEFTPNLEDGATRAEALVMVGKALGWLNTMTEAERKITTVPGYTDVPDWAAPYVKYAVDHNITKGIGHGKFGANLPVNEKMIYSWYARALLYTEDVWKNPYLLVDIGMITKAQAEAILAMKPADRDTLVGILFSAMQWKEKGSNMRLIQKLVKNAWVNAKAAEEAGLLDPTTTTMAYSLSALSLMGVRIDFPYILKASSVEKDNLVLNLITKPVAPATADIVTPVADSAYSLVVVEKSVYLFLNTKQTSGTILSVEIKADTGGAAIESVSGHKAAVAVKTIVLADTTAPTVKDVKALSPKLLEVTFSEPMSTSTDAILAKFWIDGVARKASTPSVTADTAVFNVTRTVLSVTLLADLSEGPHAVFIEKGLQDDSTLPTAEDFSKNLLIDFDKTAPSVASVVVVDRDDLIVTFSEAIQATGTITVEGTEYPVLASMINGKTVSIHMGTPFTKEADSMNHLLLVKQIKDLDGNKRDSESFVYTIAVDSTAPLATVTILSAGVLKVEFNEPINGFDNDDYLLTNNATEPVSVPSSFVYTAATGSAKAFAVITMTTIPTVTTTVKLTLNPTEVSTIMDESVNQNRLEKITTTHEFVITAPITTP